jgi:hypothetical protein
MTDEDLKDMRVRANQWIHVSGEPAVTRATALNEEHLALDVVELIDEVERLRKEAEGLAANWTLCEVRNDQLEAVYEAAKAWRAVVNVPPYIRIDTAQECNLATAVDAVQRAEAKEKSWLADYDQCETCGEHCAPGGSAEFAQDHSAATCRIVRHVEKSGAP